MSEGLFDTRVSARLGIELPILGAPMGGCAGPDLVAAVSNAGGLGILGHATLEPDEVLRQIRRTKQLTARPFGIGLLFPANDGKLVAAHAPAHPLPRFLEQFIDTQTQVSEPPKRYDAQTAEQRLEIAIAEGVAVLTLGLGAPAHVIARAKAAGMTVIVLVGSRHAALDVEARGADILVAQGHEAGGHTGRTSTLVLVPQVVDAVKIPVVAAGGIVDGRSLAAAMMLGAEGVLIGTRLLATPEADTAPSHKQKIVDMQDDETLVSRCYTGKPSRVIRNAFTDAWKGHDSELRPMPEQWDMVAPVVVPAKAKGSIAVGNWPTGQGAALIHDLSPAGEVVQKMAAEAEALVHRFGRPRASGGPGC
ncbi:nitronate monooxygenase [Roseiarcaceae bacterium H3SJ34-1]|uniref:NAD(P)H-dependent flavin oxidoreductase n=1 Tax=Terripilifer ovatus TaxID=3032367 RepID=UPI003AB975CF|nr:nitronate monooxygenase [Roseiarcaceae bacterium H3SJ34-1]